MSKTHETTNISKHNHCVFMCHTKPEVLDWTSPQAEAQQIQTLSDLSQTKLPRGTSPLCTTAAWLLSTFIPPLVYILQWLPAHSLILPSSIHSLHSHKTPSTKIIKLCQSNNQPSECHTWICKSHSIAFPSHSQAVSTLTPRLWPWALSSALRSIVLPVVLGHQHGLHIPCFLFSFRTLKC